MKLTMVCSFGIRMVTFNDDRDLKSVCNGNLLFFKVFNGRNIYSCN